MKALLRGFVAGFGFALGASVAGTLIGYAIGRIGEASVKRLFWQSPTSSPSPSSSQPSSGPSDSNGDGSNRPDHDYEPAADGLCYHCARPEKVHPSLSIQPMCGESDGQGHSCTQQPGHDGYHADLLTDYHGPMTIPRAADDDDLTNEEKIALMVKYGRATQEEAVTAVMGEPVHHKSHYDAFSCEQCSYRTSVKEKAFGHHIATGHDIFDEKPDVPHNAGAVEMEQDAERILRGGFNPNAEY